MATKKETQPTLISIKNKYVSSNSLLNEYFSSVTSVSSVILNPIEDEKTESSPERLLFLAVIYQAILDASREELPNESDLIKRQRKEALSWFFNDKYIDDLDEVCYLAGINSMNKEVGLVFILLNKLLTVMLTLTVNELMFL